MTQSTVICVALVAALGVILAAEQPQYCQNVDGMANVTASKLVGMWYAVARAPAANSSCIRSNVTLAKNDTQLNVTISYLALKPSHMDNLGSFYINTTEVYNNTGFNVSVTENNSTVTFKIIDTDYTSYVTVCGYTSSDNSTSFGAVFARNATVAKTWLGNIVNSTSNVLSNFNNNTVGSVSQEGCGRSSASTSVPYLTSVFALLFVVAKLLN